MRKIHILIVLFCILESMGLFGQVVIKDELILKKPVKSLSPFKNHTSRTVQMNTGIVFYGNHGDSVYALSDESYDIVNDIVDDIYRSSRKVKGILRGAHLDYGGEVIFENGCATGTGCTENPDLRGCYSETVELDGILLRRKSKMYIRTPTLGDLEEIRSLLFAGIIADTMINVIGTDCEWTDFEEDDVYSSLKGYYTGLNIGPFTSDVTVSLAAMKCGDIFDTGEDTLIYNFSDLFVNVADPECPADEVYCTDMPDFPAVFIYVEFSVDHYDVTLNPDSIVYGDTASVQAIARSIDNEEINLADDTPMLVMTLPDEMENFPYYGDLIDTDGHREEELIIPYGELKQGNCWFVADGEDVPEDTVSLKIGVINPEDINEDVETFEELLGLLSYKELVILPKRDYFQVNVTPDTICYGDTATVTIQAKDEEYNDIDLPLETMVKFELDTAGARLGSFIDNEAQGITYQIAHTEGVKYVANGDDPNGLPQILIEVYESANSDMRGEENLVLKDSIEFSFEIPAQNEVWPTLRGRDGGNPNNRNMKQNIELTVMKNFHEMAGQEITINVNMILPSGGHDHVNQPVNNIKGLLHVNNPNVQGHGTLTFQVTNLTSMLIDYTAPEMGGRFEISARAQILNRQYIKRDTLIVRVPGLVELEAGNSYELVGASENNAATNDPCRTDPPISLHDGHFGTQNLITAIINIANAYYRDNNSVRIRVNDMSLEYGGLFDCMNNWQTPHSSHRTGIHADIGFSGIDLNNACINSLDLDQLQRIFVNCGINWEIHNNNHYHITVN